MSQGTLVNPTSGTLSGLSAIQTLNNSFDALVTKNSGATAPANTQSGTPELGQDWLDTSTTPYTWRMFDGAAWVVVGWIDATNHVFVAKGKTGDGREFWGTSTPPGSVQPYGQTLLIASFPALFAEFGTQYGGDGITTFGLPDKRGRVTAALDNMGGTAANRLTSGGSGIAGTTLGAAGGAETHVLTIGELATHTPGFTDPGHIHSIIDPGHHHQFNLFLTSTPNGAANIHSIDSSGSTNTTTATTGITINTSTTGITMSPIGSSTAHLNAQPTIVANYYIWT